VVVGVAFLSNFVECFGIEVEGRSGAKEDSCDGTEGGQ